MTAPTVEVSGEPTHLGGGGGGREVAARERALDGFYRPFADAA